MINFPYVILLDRLLPQFPVGKEHYGNNQIAAITRLDAQPCMVMMATSSVYIMYTRTWIVRIYYHTMHTTSKD